MVVNLGLFCFTKFIFSEIEIEAKSITSVCTALSFNSYPPVGSNFLILSYFVYAILSMLFYEISLRTRKYTNISLSPSSIMVFNFFSIFGFLRMAFDSTNFIKRNWEKKKSRGITIWSFMSNMPKLTVQLNCSSIFLLAAIMKVINIQIPIKVVTKTFTTTIFNRWRGWILGLVAFLLIS